MGQGQEEVALATIDDYAKRGGWVMLQNLHLMQSFLPILERRLEVVADSAHERFRCFISAEPPPFTYNKNMPESLMQTCIKVANEAPADIKSNLRAAWANFSQDWIDSSSKPANLKANLMTLCFYHAVVLGRRRFGQQGWSRKYSFNVGDLMACANVLKQYVQTEHLYNIQCVARNIYTNMCSFTLRPDTVTHTELQRYSFRYLDRIDTNIGLYLLSSSFQVLRSLRSYAVGGPTVHFR